MALMYSIGGVKLNSPFMLAPLAGVTDGAMRSICFEQGAACACSEMVSAKGLWYGDRNTEELLTLLPGEGPVGYQIFGHEPEIIAFAAKTLRDRRNVILDINMGCPVPKVVKNFEGSYLMKEPDRVYDIVSAAVREAGKPVTVKLRAGWDSGSINAPEVAAAAEAGGASAVAVHGRTREQFYSGRADRSVILKVRERVSIPVIGNGDVTDPESAFSLMDETGCDFVMIGRGALGNPWIFSELERAYAVLKRERALKGEFLKTYKKAVENGEFSLKRPSGGERCRVMLRQLSLMEELKGPDRAVREMRKHVGWYLRGIPGAARMRDEVNRITDGAELRAAIQSILSGQQEY